MDILSIPMMIEREKEVFQSGLTAQALMEAAGEAMARRILALYPQTRRFVIFIGKGNNGGDGLVVACHLAREKQEIQVVLTSEAAQLGELPRIQFNRLRASFPNLEILTWHEDFAFPGSEAVVVDALLGVQARGELRAPLAGIVARINAARTAHFFRTVALDLPSGLAAYAGTPAPENHDSAIVADVTLAVGFAKDVLCREALAGWVGRIEVVPWSRQRAQSAPRQVLVAHELAALLPRRSALSHKNDFGQLAIITGSIGFTGASGLCTQAAQAMGAGLLCVITHSDASAIVASQAPHEAMVSAWSDAHPEIIEKAAAIIIGPGLGQSGQTLHMLKAVLRVGCPVLIDADALSVLAKNLHLLDEARGPFFLRPTPARWDA